MTARAAFASCVGQKDREQTVWTPPWFLDAVDQVFPEGWFDPYPSAGSPATIRSKVSVGEFKYDAREHPWADRNFANPPYDKLKDHMPRMREQFELEDRQTIGLVPVRTRREWWCASAAGHSVAFLKPVTFVDAKTGEPINGSMPENMAAVYWGERKALFTVAFAPLSHTGEVLMRVLSWFLIVVMPAGIVANAYFAFHGHATNAVVGACLFVQFLIQYPDLRRSL